MNPVRAYEYLMLSRARLFDWIRPLSHEDYTRKFPFGLHTVRATMIEIAGGEWAFARRLREERLPPWEEWPFQKERLPTFKDLEEAWGALAQQTLRTFKEVRDWSRVIVFRAKEGDEVMTSEAIRGLESVVTLTFDGQEGGTRVRLHHANLPDDAMGRRHQEGWRFVLGALAERLTRRGASLTAPTFFRGFQRRKHPAP